MERINVTLGYFTTAIDLPFPCLLLSNRLTKVVWMLPCLKDEHGGYSKEEHCIIQMKVEGKKDIKMGFPGLMGMKQYDWHMMLKMLKIKNKNVVKNLLCFFNVFIAGVCKETRDFLFCYVLLFYLFFMFLPFLFFVPTFFPLISALLSLSVIQIHSFKLCAILMERSLGFSFRS